MEGYIDLKRLTLDELMGIINLYPWFGGARMELCSRMAALGEDMAGEEQFAAAAMYVPSRRKVADKMRRGKTGVIADSDVNDIIKSYVTERENQPVEKPKRRVYAGAGDYFSQEDYDKVKRSDDNVFSQYARRAKDSTRTEVQADPVFDIFTETLAQIYAEQGYYEQAKDIYSKLILAYPEKNAYFAALIQKLDELN